MMKDPQMQCTTVGAGAGAALLGAGMPFMSFHGVYVRVSYSLFVYIYIIYVLQLCLVL